MREMGNLAGVPIEPPEQTALLDTCMSVAGVIGGGVPGGKSDHFLLTYCVRPVLNKSSFLPLPFSSFPLAGGYDAIWLLVFDPAECPQNELPSTRIQGVWQNWKGLSVSPLLATESTEKGARVEDVNAIPGLSQAVLGVPY